jgi:hypothetical protein
MPQFTRIIVFPIKSLDSMPGKAAIEVGDPVATTEDMNLAHHQ